MKQRYIWGLLIFLIAISGCITKGYTPIIPEPVTAFEYYSKEYRNQKYKSLYIKYDEFDDVSYIRHKHFLGANKPIEIYEANNRLLVKLHYHGSAVIVGGPCGHKVSFDNLDYCNEAAHIGSDGNAFKFTGLLSDNTVKDLLCILSSPGIKKARFLETYHGDYTLDNNTTIALIEVMEYYFDRKHLENLENAIKEMQDNLGTKFPNIQFPNPK